MAAFLVLILFAAAVIWTTVVGLGGTCLTSDGDSPLPASTP
jgi:hypothetical protein